MESIKSTELSEENSMSDIHTEDTEESKSIETSQLLTVLNKPTHNENDTPENKYVAEIELPKENGEQDIRKENKLLTTNFEVKIENQKLKGP